jgi:hypothetical protein
LLRCDSVTPGGLLHSATFGDIAGVDDPARRREIILAVAEGRASSARPVPRLFGGAMPLENRMFTGRGALLAELYAALSVVDGTAALTQAAVHGLGGVGKTTLARSMSFGMAPATTESGGSSQPIGWVYWRGWGSWRERWTRICRRIRRRSGRRRVRCGRSRSAAAGSC